MKKLLGILAAVGMVATAGTAVVACTASPKASNGQTDPSVSGLNKKIQELEAQIQADNNTITQDQEMIDNLKYNSDKELQELQDAIMKAKENSAALNAQITELKTLLEHPFTLGTIEKSTDNKTFEVEFGDGTNANYISDNGLVGKDVTSTITINKYSQNKANDDLTITKATIKDTSHVEITLNHAFLADWGDGSTLTDATGSRQQSWLSFSTTGYIETTTKENPVSSKIGKVDEIFGLLKSNSMALALNDVQRAIPSKTGAVLKTLDTPTKDGVEQQIIINLTGGTPNTGTLISDQFSNWFVHVDGAGTAVSKNQSGATNGDSKNPFIQPIIKTAEIQNNNGKYQLVIGIDSKIQVPQTSADNSDADNWFDGYYVAITSTANDISTGKDGNGHQLGGDFGLGTQITQLMKTDGTLFIKK